MNDGIKERLYFIRKSKNLNQEDFGKRTGVTRSAVCNYENGTRPIGEQVIVSVCNAFGVCEEWLRTGKGKDMFVQKSSLDELAKNAGLTVNERVLIEKFMNLNPETRREMLDYIKDVADAMEAGNAPGTELTPEEALYKEAYESASNTKTASA